nr:immunoglobulin heavy chain junction region [Mus musculus]
CARSEDAYEDYFDYW